jgi:hypothetical protein
VSRAKLVDVVGLHNVSSSSWYRRFRRSPLPNMLVNWLFGFVCANVVC